MAYRGMRIASIVVVAAMAAIAVAALARLPAGALLPTHWGLDGQVDGRMAAPHALFLPVGVTAAITLLLALLPAIEPLQDRLSASAPLFRTAWGGTLAMMTLAQIKIAAPAFGVTLPATLPLTGAGLLLIAVGNVLPKSRPGFFVGIRTPWTLIDPENWIATHRLGAWTTMAAGALFVLAALVPPDAGAMRIAIPLAIALCLAPVPYSWWLWHRTRAR